jgi:ferritin-like metal-binding protein YciE
VESYEICAYEWLIRRADQMGHTKASKLLTQNLKEEQATLKKMQSFSKKLKPQNMGMDEEEDSEEEMSMNDDSQQSSNGSRKKSSSRRGGSRRAA